MPASFSGGELFCFPFFRKLLTSFFLSLLRPQSPLSDQSGSAQITLYAQLHRLIRSQLFPPIFAIRALLRSTAVFFTSPDSLPPPQIRFFIFFLARNRTGDTLNGFMGRWYHPAVRHFFHVDQHTFTDVLTPLLPLSTACSLDYEHFFRELFRHVFFVVHFATPLDVVFCIAAHLMK